MLRLIIGNKVYSSWSLRGWLAVKQSGLPFEELVVPLYDEAWEARRAQADMVPSRGKVPMLWDGDTPIWESLAIIGYLDGLTGGGRYWPMDKAARALALSMAAEMHAGYQALRSEHTMNTRHVLPAKTPSVAVQADIDRILGLWTQARSRFGAGGDYLFGTFGAADIMFAPVVTRFTTYSLPTDQTGRAYIEAVTAHPFMREWLAGAAAEGWIIDKFEPASA